MATVSERVTTHCIYLVPPERPSSLPLVPLARGTRRWVSLHFALALLLQVPGSPLFAPYGVTMPSHSWALLPVLLLLSLLLPVAAEWRMEKQRAGGASCYVECRIRGKLHSPPLGPPIVAFIPPLHFPQLFRRKVSIYRAVRENLSVRTPNLYCPKQASSQLHFRCYTVNIDNACRI